MPWVNKNTACPCERRVYVWSKGVAFAEADDVWKLDLYCTKHIKAFLYLYQRSEQFRETQLVTGHLLQHLMVTKAFTPVEALLNTTNA